MSDLMLATYVKTQIALRDRMKAIAERGQNSLEYIGIAVIAGIVIVAIYGAINGQLSGAIADGITKVINGGK